MKASLFDSLDVLGIDGHWEGKDLILHGFPSRDQMDILVTWPITGIYLQLEEQRFLLANRCPCGERLEDTGFEHDCVCPHCDAVLTRTVTLTPELSARDIIYRCDCGYLGDHYSLPHFPTER